MCKISLMKITNDGRSSLDEGLGSKRRFNHPTLSKKSHAKNKKPRCPRGKKKPNSDKRHEVQPVELLEQELLVPVTLEEFFPGLL